MSSRAMEEADADAAAATSWAFRNAPDSIGDDRSVYLCVEDPPTQWHDGQLAVCSKIVMRLEGLERSSSGKPEVALEALDWMILSKTSIQIAMAMPDSDGYAYSTKMSVTLHTKLVTLYNDAKQSSASPVVKFVAEMLGYLRPSD